MTDRAGWRALTLRSPLRGLLCRPLLGLLLCLLAATRPVHAAALISPEQAYVLLAATGVLRDVQIEGDLDLARMRPRADGKALLLQRVHLKGRLLRQPLADATTADAALDISDSTLAGIHLVGSTLRGAITLQSSRVDGPARFDDARVEAPLVLHNVNFAPRAVFRRALFSAPLEITNCTFEEAPGTRGGISFGDARFAAPVRLDRSVFRGGLNFDSARFADDASFIGLEVAGGASWRNVQFARDVEFRYCRLGDADFGNAELMSVFAGLADFRGCRMRSLRLDYADLRGDAMFVNLKVEGRMSLREAALRGPRSDFTGLRVGDGLDLTGAHISALHARWADLGPAVLRAAPDSGVLGLLQQRLKASSQADDARDVQALLAEQLIEERLQRPDIDLTERARLHAERWVWGRSTGYGTQLGRITLLCLLAWLALSTPLALWPGLRIARWAGELKAAPPRHQAAAPDALLPAADGRWQRARVAWAFGFGLMYALPALPWRAAAPLPPGVAPWLATMRAVGLLLLALLALTLAQVSPVFQAIVGKVLG